MDLLDVKDWPISVCLKALQNVYDKYYTILVDKGDISSLKSIKTQEYQIFFNLEYLKIPYAIGSLLIISSFDLLAAFIKVLTEPRQTNE